VNALYYLLILQKEETMTSRYKIRQKMLSIGDDFWIENQEGERVFKVDGKALRLRKTLIFEDLKGNTLAKIQERLLAIKDTMAVEDADGNQMAVIKKGLIAPLGDHWKVTVRGGADLDVQGNILDHEYSINERRRKIAEVSKKWLSITDTYGVEINDGQNDILILALAIAIDMMSHDDDSKKRKK
jgi:uncharacterized protein YxjI